MAAGLNVRTEGERSELDGGIYLLLKSLAIYSAVPPPPSRGTYRDPSVSATANCRQTAAFGWRENLPRASG